VEFIVSGDGIFMAKRLLKGGDSAKAVT